MGMAESGLHGGCQVTERYLRRQPLLAFTGGRPDAVVNQVHPISTLPDRVLHLREQRAYRAAVSVAIALS